MGVDQLAEDHRIQDSIQTVWGQTRAKWGLDQHNPSNYLKEFKTKVELNIWNIFWYFISSRYDGVVFQGSFTFYGLQPGSIYQVLVRAKNEEGWSDKGKPFQFSTHEEEDMGLMFFSEHTNSSGIHFVMQKLLFMIMVWIYVSGWRRR